MLQGCGSVPSLVLVQSTPARWTLSHLLEGTACIHLLFYRRGQHQHWLASSRRMLQGREGRSWKCSSLESKVAPTQPHLQLMSQVSASFAVFSPKSCTHICRFPTAVSHKIRGWYGVATLRSCGKQHCYHLYSSLLYVAAWLLLWNVRLPLYRRSKDSMSIMYS